MVKIFRVGVAFFLALVCVGSFVSVSTNSPAWAVNDWTQVGSAISGEASSDNSGDSVALSTSGNRIAIGAERNSSGGQYRGHVRVYDLTGGAWVQVGSDIDGEANRDYSGASVSLSSDGSRVAIGAFANYASETGINGGVGHVRVYDLSGGAWTQVGSDIDGEAIADYSGWSVSLSSDGSRVAIGAVNNSGSGFSAGHVRVYELTGGAWTQVGSDINGEAANDDSGYSVSLSSDGSRVAIGAAQNDGGGIDAGHVRVYDLTGGAWVQVGSDIDGEAAGDLSGESVSLSSDGSTVAIGAVNNDGSGANAGHVRVYELTGGAWVQVGSDVDGEAAGDSSGYSVSLTSDGSRVAIGAIGNDGAGSDAGNVRVYELTGGAWVPVGSCIRGQLPGDNSGSAVMLSSDGSRVAIAARYNGIPLMLAGHVRVFDLTSSGGGTCGGGGGGGSGGITSEPRSLTASSRGSASKLAWKEPKSLNGGTITDYIIQYRVNKTTLWSTFADGISTSRTATVTGLTKGVKYQFQVSARTSGGDSPFSRVKRAS